MAENTPIPEAYVMATELVGKAIEEQGYSNLKAYPGIASASAGGWTIEVHAQSCQEIDHLPAFFVRVKWNGWPAGVITPAGGTIAGGELANEDTLVEALKEALG